MRVSFNPEALAEAEEATRWYRENGGSSPIRAFTQELRRIVQLAAEQPGIGAPGSHGTARLHFKTLSVHIDFSHSRIIRQGGRHCPSKPPTRILG